MLCVVLGGPKKRPELSHGVMQQSRWNESAEKHVCNEQTSSNMSMNFHLKHFNISRDTSEKVLHVIKQCLQAVRHCCWLYARTCVRRKAWTICESQRSSECYQGQMARCRWPDSHNERERKKFINHKQINNVTMKIINSCGRLPARKIQSSWPPMQIQIILFYM